MIVNTLKLLFNRDLEKLKSEIESYRDEKNIWLTDGNIKNSGGNLCLHLIGNLNTYIGVALAKTDYVRQRDLEFSLKDIPKAVLIEKIAETMLVVERGLDTLTPEQMSGDFPMVIWDESSEAQYTLIHLLTHLNYHLGQINYHRRLLDK